MPNQAYASDLKHIFWFENEGKEDVGFDPIQTYMKWEAVKNDLRHDELQTITPAMQERVAWTAETALENKFIIFITVTSDYADD